MLRPYLLVELHFPHLHVLLHSCGSLDHSCMVGLQFGELLLLQLLLQVALLGCRKVACVRYRCLHPVRVWLNVVDHLTAAGWPGAAVLLTLASCSSCSWVRRPSPHP